MLLSNCRIAYYHLAYDARTLDVYQGLQPCRSTTAGSTYCGLNGILDCTSALRKHKEREVEMPLLCFVLKQLYTNV